MRKIKSKNKINININEEIKKDYDYHMFNNALTVLQGTYLNYFLYKSENPFYHLIKNKKIKLEEKIEYESDKINFTKMKGEIMESFDFLLPIINETLKASFTIFMERDEKINYEVVRSKELHFLFQNLLNQKMQYYKNKYIKNIMSPYFEIEQAFTVLIQAFACYDIMEMFIDNANLKKENFNYCKNIINDWKNKYKIKCIEIIEEAEYNPNEQILLMDKLEKLGYKADNKIYTRLVRDKRLMNI